MIYFYTNKEYIITQKERYNMSVKHIDVYNTHIELYPYKKDDIPIIEEMYTANEKFTRIRE